jgi:hypothetical protein
MTKPIYLADYRNQRKRGKSRVSFDRQELRQLLDVYSRRVATGEWRDYAIDIRTGTAIFSIFRHTFDTPAFAVTKQSQGRHCQYSVFSGSEKLKHGKTIGEVLAVFDKQPHLVAFSR